VISNFPVEFWCEGERRQDLLTYLDAIVRWTSDRLFPSWAEKKDRQRRSTDMFEWIRALSGLIARALPYVSAEEAINRFIVPFSKEAYENGLEVVANVTDKAICRHVYDAPSVTDATLTVLRHCLERMLQERTFNVDSWRAGEINSHELSEMIRSFLLVSVENAPGAMRFANGAWSELPRMIPLIDVLMQRAGWSLFVIGTYLTLCERAGAEFPIETFIRHITALSDAQGNFPAQWSGSNVAARISSVVQLMAEANRPLTRVHARELLLILDRLVDTGDRRAAALQQSEHFRGVQLGATDQGGPQSVGRPSSTPIVCASAPRVSCVW
jgi:hypothetical protein